MFPAWLSGSVTHEPSLSVAWFFPPLPQALPTPQPASQLSLWDSWSPGLGVSLSIPLHAPRLCPASHSCCHCSSRLLGRAQNDSSWALGGRGEMRQPDRRATTRTPGQPRRRALKAGTGTTGCLSETECTYACVSVSRCVTAPSSSLLPSSKILHKSAALLAVSFPLLEERECSECSCVIPTIVLVESAWVKGVTIL